MKYEYLAHRAIHLEPLYWSVVEQLFFVMSCYGDECKSKKVVRSPFFRSWVQLHRKDLDEIFECTVGSGDCWNLDLRW